MTTVHLVHAGYRPDHTINIALSPNAEVVDFWVRYHGDLWLDHDGEERVPGGAAGSVRRRVRDGPRYPPWHRDRLSAFIRALH